MSHKFRPESLMMSHGYKPEWSEGAVKCPIFQTSTFVFDKAESGKAFFELAYGKREKGVNEVPGLIYSRLNNPDLQILEERLCLWDGAEEAAVFESGMSAITTVLMEFLKPGDLLLYSRPVYGGTDHFINEFLPKYGIEVLEYFAWDTEEEILQKLEISGNAHKLRVIYCETPANPTNEMFDLKMLKSIKDKFHKDEENEVVIAVDNTYLGPIWQNPIKWGADLVLYSATKYIGGHSDIIAGAVLGTHAHLARVKGLRTFMGNMAGPWTGWLLMRSLETLKLRMEAQQQNALEVVKFLESHASIEKVYYIGSLDAESRSGKIREEQCTGTGAMVAFDVKGGEQGAFQFLNQLKLVKLAVSLGSTESLAQHPKTMTHAGVPEADLQKLGITDSMVRLSVGVEHYNDIIWDLKQSLDQVKTQDS